MRAIGVEGSTTIGAKFLDGFLRGKWPLRDYLIRDRLTGCLAVRAGGLHRLRIDQLRRIVGPEILDHSLRHKNERDDQANREQNPKKASSRVDPEVADGLRFPARDAANNRD